MAPSSEQAGRTQHWVVIASCSAEKALPAGAQSFNSSRFCLDSAVEATSKEVFDEDNESDASDIIDDYGVSTVMDSLKEDSEDATDDDDEDSEEADNHQPTASDNEDDTNNRLQFTIDLANSDKEDEQDETGEDGDLDLPLENADNAQSWHFGARKNILCHLSPPSTILRWEMKPKLTCTMRLTKLRTTLTIWTRNLRSTRATLTTWTRTLRSRKKALAMWPSLTRGMTLLRAILM
jgi:hypothetical protein